MLEIATTTSEVAGPVSQRLAVELLPPVTIAGFTRKRDSAIVAGAGVGGVGGDAGCGDGATVTGGELSLHALAPTTTAMIARADIARRDRIERLVRVPVEGKATGMCGIVATAESKRYTGRKGYRARSIAGAGWLSPPASRKMAVVLQTHARSFGTSSASDHKRVRMSGIGVGA